MRVFHQRCGRHALDSSAQDSSALQRLTLGAGVLAVVAVLARPTLWRRLRWWLRGSAGVRPADPTAPNSELALDQTSVATMQQGDDRSQAPANCGQTPTVVGAGVDVAAPTPQVVLGFADGSQVRLSRTDPSVSAFERLVAVLRRRDAA